MSTCINCYRFRSYADITEFPESEKGQGECGRTGEQVSRVDSCSHYEDKSMVDKRYEEFEEE